MYCLFAPCCRTCALACFSFLFFHDNNFTMTVHDRSPRCAAQKAKHTAIFSFFKQFFHMQKQIKLLLQFLGAVFLFFFTFCRPDKKPYALAYSRKRIFRLDRFLYYVDYQTIIVPFYPKAQPFTLKTQHRRRCP